MTIFLEISFYPDGGRFCNLMFFHQIDCGENQNPIKYQFN